MSGKLTVLVTCKNERTNIGPCLDSAAQVADEILVADSGSTDGTLGYLRARGGCRLIYGDYTTSGDFKNWAVPHATHEWILVLDSDERVTKDLATEIRKLLEDGPEADGYWVGRTNHLMGHRVRYTDWARDRLVRLFRRDLGKYEGPSDHGDVRVATGKLGVLRAPLDHYTTWSWSQYLSKLDRYTRVQAEHWYAAGRKPSWRRLLFQPPLRFLRDYVLHLGFLDGAVGIQIAWTSAFYSFLKQARLWELHRGLKQSDVEPEAMAVAEQKIDQRKAPERKAA
jgi:glycosyltransferase involved in cell wall biosynthesis